MKTIFEIVVCMFATYGFIGFLHEILLTIKHNMKYETSMVKLVLIVKNQGEIIEGVLRNILQRDFIRKLMPGGRLIVLDMGSNDDTIDILRKLEKDFECIQVLKKSEKEGLFKSFDECEEQEIGVEHIGRKV
jgi:hypothetical protein